MGDEIPCRSVTPHYDRESAVFRCRFCKQGIYQGELFYDIYGEKFHTDCVSENYTAREMLELVGIKEEIAQVI